MNFEEWFENYFNNLPNDAEKNAFKANLELIKRTCQAALQSQWQPIKTIIDYDNVLLCNRNRIEKGFLGECGFYAAYPICPSPKLDFNPTHWQPLPPLPLGV